MIENQEVMLKGIPVSEGISIGTAFFLKSEERKVSTVCIATSEVDQEITRYRNALFSSREDLEQIKTHLAEEASHDVATIIDSHLHMLEDPFVTEQIEERIRQNLQNPESAFQAVMEDYGRRFSQNTNTFFQDRLLDVRDLAQRVLGHLNPSDDNTLCQIPFLSVVFAKELIPSQIATVDPSRVCAFVTKNSGGQSHSALIARAKGIPYVGDIDIDACQEIEIRCVIVDGLSGVVILNPSHQTIERYRVQKTRLKISFHLLQKELEYDVETTDGYPVSIYANIGHLDEWEAAQEFHPDGIGLFRSEYLFLQRRSLLLPEEEQYQIYSKLVQSAEGRPVVIRVFDLGGDKTPHWVGSAEVEPVLMCRGLRFLFHYPELFKTQLRALLRAAVHGDLRILLPLVSDRQEVDRVKGYLDEVAFGLLKEGIAHRKEAALGCMIELPSAVLLCDVLAKQCDFLSIGTNDLMQYTLGIDRNQSIGGNPCIHPSVVRMIKMVCVQAAQEKKPVTLCGELASNPLFIPLLLGLGIHRFSCSPRYIPQIKRMVRNTSFVTASELAEQVLSLDTTEAVIHLLNAQNNSLSS